MWYLNVLIIYTILAKYEVDCNCINLFTRFYSNFPNIHCNLTSLTFSDLVLDETQAQHAIHTESINFVKTFTKRNGNGEVGDRQFTLLRLLEIILQHNADITGNKPKKGLWLNFYHTDDMENAIPILKSFHDSIDFPVILNADIIVPKNVQNPTNHINPKTFLQHVPKLPNYIISVGWCSNHDDFADEQLQIDDVHHMLNNLSDFDISTESVFYNLRATVASKSVEVLKHAKESAPLMSLSLWSHRNDVVDVKGLNSVVGVFGVERVVLHLQGVLKDELDLTQNGLINGVSRVDFGGLMIVMGVVGWMWVA